MLLGELRVFALEGLQLSDLASWPDRWWLRDSAAQSTLFHILPPFGKHERVNLECRRDGLDLNSGLLAQANRSELELVRVAPNFARPSSWHTSPCVR